MTTTAVPVENCFVRRYGETRDVAARVCGRAASPERVPLEWQDGTRTFEDASMLEPCFGDGWRVWHVPDRAGQKSLGNGTIRGTRTLAGRGQILVQFDSDGLARWMPYERFARFPTVPMIYDRRQIGDRILDAERFVLKTSAYALSTWNEQTGSFGRLDIDPLPHQIFVAHHVARAGHFNFLIADDVGLGKTVEIGLMMRVLETRIASPRILVVVPAGLTLQWQTEMREKFERNFVVHGDGFTPSEPWEWKLQNRVVASIDTLKPREEAEGGGDAFDVLMRSDEWDMIVFDEGHKLTREDDGESTQRYRLAQALRRRTRNLVIASGTPHDGNTGRFRNLLLLLRPDLQREIDRIQYDPSVIGQIVLRNRKSDVTDANGEFIFKGHSVSRVEIEPSEETLELEDALRDYIRSAYTGVVHAGEARRRAVGFVLSTYRKLASSSAYALQKGLERRLARIEEADVPDAPDLEDGAEAAVDRAGSATFFAAERAVLGGLIERAREAVEHDRKLREFVSQVPGFVRTAEGKLLVFTEFRDTMILLERHLTAAGMKVSCLMGGMTAQEKKGAIAEFEESSDILLSTEAGAEGYNLHRHCFVEVNYDMPWNPVKLIQRIGRLYRYGQERRVAIVNLQSSHSIDAQIVDYAYRRVETIVAEMANVSGEFLDNYAAEVLGNLLSHFDLERIVEETRGERIERSRERIEEALRRARTAAAMQDEILSGATSFDDAFFESMRSFGTGHVAMFVRRAAPLFEIGIENGAQTERFRMRLPDSMKGRFAEFGSRTVVEATTDRRTASRHPGLHLLDFDSEFVRHLVDEAKTSMFAGFYAELEHRGGPGSVAAFVVRWQDELGEPSGEEIVVVRSDASGVRIDPRIATQLLEESESASADAMFEGATGVDAMRAVVEKRIAGMAGPSRHPSLLMELTAARLVSVAQAVDVAA